jgi:hypothetical protein
MTPRFGLPASNQRAECFRVEAERFFHWHGEGSPHRFYAGLRRLLTLVTLHGGDRFRVKWSWIGFERRYLLRAISCGHSGQVMRKDVARKSYANLSSIAFHDLIENA